VITAGLDTWFMIGRQLRNLMRQPIWVAMILIQPMIWLLLYGQLFKKVVVLPGFGHASYVTFLAPGIVVMNAFFGATWSGMAMIDDLERHVIERFLATPASRASLVLSQVVRAGFIASIQALVILLVALALGVRVHQGAVGWLLVMLTSFLVGTAFGGVSQGLALIMRKEASMIATANFIGLPLLFLSSSLLSRPAMPHWMRELARFNPVEWGVVAARESVLPGTDWGSIGVHLALLLGLTALTAAFATWAFRLYQRTL
jgi:ABC-2 type transport system permease protein